MSQQLQSQQQATYTIKDFFHFLHWIGQNGWQYDETKNNFWKPKKGKGLEVITKSDSELYDEYILAYPESLQSQQQPQNIKPVEQQEDKISDEDLEKMAKEFAGSNYLKNHQPKTWEDRYRGFIHGFKACLQKGSEDKITYDNLYEDFKKLDEYNINLREENKRYKEAIQRLENSEDKIRKAIEFCEEKEEEASLKKDISFVSHGKHLAFKEMKTFLQQL